MMSVQNAQSFLLHNLEWMELGSLVLFTAGHFRCCVWCDFSVHYLFVAAAKEWKKEKLITNKKKILERKSRVSAAQFERWRWRHQQTPLPHHTTQDNTDKRWTNISVFYFHLVNFMCCFGIEMHKFLFSFTNCSSSGTLLSRSSTSLLGTECGRSKRRENLTKPHSNSSTRIGM